MTVTRTRTTLTTPMMTEEEEEEGEEEEELETTRKGDPQLREMGPGSDTKLSRASRPLGGPLRRLPALRGRALTALSRAWKLRVAPP